MLPVYVPAAEFFDERTEEFIEVKACTLQLEHSLISISKWEAKWRKPFLGTDEKTEEETLDYIRCMTITQNVDPMVYKAMPNSEIQRIKEYINAPMTATWFKDDKRPPSRKVITSELVYYWMIAQNIPFECEKWHFNRLMTLIRICGEKSAPQKKMSKSDRKSLMAQRRAASRRPRV